MLVRKLENDIPDQRFCNGLLRGRGDIARPASRPQCIPCVRFVPRPLRFVKGTLLGEEDRWLGVGDADSALV